ncbi:fucolectin-like [Eleutherodactylus coqui]|uniref:fucolectin-like n=1 Tax=Eleutherodactylus coqui TaxID=57060 RepID=UPI003461C88F
MTLLTSLILLGFLALTLGCLPEPGAINLARRGEASQDSQYMSDNMGHASNAIDGNKNTDYYKGSCAHNHYGTISWWKVDLKEVYKITTVIITNRLDCCPERLLGAEIRIGNSKDNNNPVCAKVTALSNGTLTYCCKEMEGQYISVVMPDRPEWLTLCEVEVYGKPIGKPFQTCY